MGSVSSGPTRYTVVLQFAALVVTPTVQVPTGRTSGEDGADNTEVVRLPISPRRPE